MLVIGILPFEFNGWYNARLSIRGFWCTEMLTWIAIVALNGQVVPRTEWPTTRLNPGDSIEIVRARQGG